MDFYTFMGSSLEFHDYLKAAIDSTKTQLHSLSNYIEDHRIIKRKSDFCAEHYGHTNWSSLIIYVPFDTP